MTTHNGYDSASLDAAAARVYALMQPTNQQHWPLLSELAGVEVWAKHENQTPTGAFKVRGGINYVHQLRARDANVAAVVAASTGNHGQSVAFAGTRFGMSATIVVPHGNNPEKNAAMRALGAELIEVGDDFNVAFDYARELAVERGAHLFESYHRDLVLGVGTYALELFRNAPPLDTVYVPIGMGSGCNGVVAVRDALGLDTKIVGVVAELAPAYQLSFQQRQAVTTNSCATFAEGLAVRIPNQEALTMILNGVERVVAVSDDEIALAMRQIFSATHNVVEGAGASTFAALMRERESLNGQRVGVVFSGANIDQPRYLQVLQGQTPGRTA